MILVVVLIAGFVFYVAYRTRKVPTPRRRWWRFHQPGTLPLNAAACKQLQGIYTIEQGKDFFGETAVVKWSYTIEENKTRHHVSFFCAEEGMYFVCEGRRRNNNILLHGYWRNIAASGTGTVQLMIRAAGDAIDLRSLQQPPIKLIVKGRFGDGNKKPDKKTGL